MQSSRLCVRDERSCSSIRCRFLIYAVVEDSIYVTLSASLQGYNTAQYKPVIRRTVIRQDSEAVKFWICIQEVSSLKSCEVIGNKNEV